MRSCAECSCNREDDLPREAPVIIASLPSSGRELLVALRLVEAVRVRDRLSAMACGRWWMDYCGQVNMVLESDHKAMLAHLRAGEESAVVNELARRIQMKSKLN